MATDSIVTDDLILTKIYIVRGQKIMLDKDLAELYNVSTGVFNQAVKRNSSRFPEDFCFQLTEEEYKSLISQFVISKKGTGRGGTRKSPFAFTEQGVAQLSCILNSELAIKVNIQIIRLFTRMREMLMTSKDILLKLEAIERKVDSHDRDIDEIFAYLKELLNPPQLPRRRIVFMAALQAGATSIMFAHNHPPGQLSPSNGDKVISAKFKEAGVFLDIHLMDHLIISPDGYYSMSDEGLL